MEKIPPSNMEKFFLSWKSNLVNCRLNSCCLLAPLRVGLMMIGYFNVILSVVVAMGIASSSSLHPLASLQAALFDEFSPAVCALAPLTDMAFSAVLLCALHRNDVSLLRVYLYYCAVSVGAAVLVYGAVFAGIPTLVICAIAIGLVYQGYVILLVRSMIVELKLRNATAANGAAPHKTRPDPEAMDPTEITHEPEYKTPTIQTVNEVSKLETIQENPKATVVSKGNVPATKRFIWRGRGNEGGSIRFLESSTTLKDSGIIEKGNGTVDEGRSTPNLELTTATVSNETVNTASTTDNKPNTVKGITFKTMNISKKINNDTKDTAAKESFTVTKDTTVVKDTDTVVKDTDTSTKDTDTVAKDSDTSGKNTDTSVKGSGAEDKETITAPKVRRKWWK